MIKTKELKVRIKKLDDNAVVPSYAHDTDAGMDLTATSKWYDKNGNVCYGTGLAFEIPEGYVGLVFPRSSNSNHSVLLSNSVGVIDAGYRGEVMAKFRKDYQVQQGYKELAHLTHKEYEIGERIAQMIIMPYPKVCFEVVDNLSVSTRGAGGYGSSGK